MATKPILAIDFDGTIHSYTSGWKGETKIPDPPVPGAIDALNEYVKHFDLAIFSTRAATLEGKLAIVNWLMAYGYTGELLDITDRKLPAKVTLDDRTLTFTGRWPEVEELQSFEPWTKKPPRQEYLAMVEEALVKRREELQKLEAFLRAEFSAVMAPDFAPDFTPVDHAIRLLSAYKADIGLPRLSRREYAGTASESQPGAKEGVS